MAKVTYKGTLKVGLVTCPVGVYKAAKEKKVHLNFIHKECGAKIYQKKFCTACGKLVTDPGKGFEIEKGHVVEVDENEIAALKIESEKIINIKYFTPITEVPAEAYKGKLQYLGQTKNFEDIYCLMVELLSKRKVVGIGQVSVRGRDYPIVLISVDGKLMIDELYTLEETRGREPETVKVKVDKEMFKLGEALVSGMTKNFFHAGVDSEYEESIRQVIDNTIHGKPKKVKKVEKKATPKANSMDQLRASLRAI